MPVGKSTWLQFFGGTLPVGDLSAEITFLRE